MSKFEKIGTETGQLVAEKNRAYGSSFETVGAAMQLLYPRGIAPGQMHDALLLTRIWDKMMRIATDRDAMGESPYRDIAGYGILGTAMHEQQQKGHATPCGSANAADEQSQGPNASAVNVAAAPTTPSANGRNGKPFSAPLNSAPASCSTTKVSAAPTAGKPSFVVGDALAKSLSGRHEILSRGEARNRLNQCAYCQCELDRNRVFMREGFELLFDAYVCVGAFEVEIASVEAR